MTELVVRREHRHALSSEAGIALGSLGTDSAGGPRETHGADIPLGPRETHGTDIPLGAGGTGITLETLHALRTCWSLRTCRSL